MTIEQKTNRYYTALISIQTLVAQSDYEEAAKLGLLTLLEANEISVSERQPLPVLVKLAVAAIEDLSRVISLNISIPELAKRLEGVLIERVAFYKQVKNSVQFS